MEYGIKKYTWSWKPRKHFPSQFHRHSIATYTCKTCKLTLGKYKSRVRLGFSIYINLTFDLLLIMPKISGHGHVLILTDGSCVDGRIYLQKRETVKECTGDGPVGEPPMLKSNDGYLNSNI